MRATAILFLFITLVSATITTALHHNHRRHLLHQPFFPVTTTVSPTQPPSQSPSLSLSPSPQPEDSPHPQRQLPKYPFSTTPNTPQKPFFPSYPSTPPPPPPSNSFLSSFPANISSLLFPHRPSSTNHSHVFILAVTLSLISVAVISTVSAAFLYFRGRQRHQNLPGKPPRSDSQRLVPPNLPPSDGNLNVQRNVSSNPSTSSEFLYLGTLVNSRSGEITTNNNNPSLKIGITTAPTSYEKLGSPELRPLPPLPKYNPSFTSGEMLFPKDTLKSDSIENQKEEKQLEKEEREYEEDDDDDDEEFFSPRGSSGGKENPQILGFKESPVRVNSSSRRDNFGSRSFNSRTASYPYSNSCSPPDSISSSCHSPATNYSPQNVIKPSLSSSSPRCNSENTPISLDSDRSRRFVPVKLPPPPPPPPPPRFWEAPAVSRPIPGFPELVPPSMPSFVQNVGPTSGNEPMRVKSENAAEEKIESRPKLKPLHWDKVRTRSDRAMVWDQLKSSSFQLNEEMIETLFMVNNSSNQNLSNDNGRRQSLPTHHHEARVLDPRKSQNIAILLRALNVTVDEVCEALLEGNSDNLGTELLESLLKMAPSKEEEQKIKEFKNESPFKLGPAEKFLKAVLDIPFAFKRVDALLYIANFDSEVDYLKRSFETLKVASDELRNSWMFFKLLDAVLKTGNRMNVGTNRGDAHAFKLDSLLKLVDVKGTDGKTTLLHFVVQEIIRSEGHRVSDADPEKTKSENTQKSDFQNDLEFRKLGLQVVSGLGGELSNVKKAAAMDSEVLGNEVSKLAAGISKIMEVVKLNDEMMMSDTGRKFSESMNGFLTKAKMEIARVQEEENVAVSMVKETSEYFHGNSSKEEAHPFRIFTVVKDFLSILDRVCREVGKINERTIYSSVRPMPANQMVPPAFPGFDGWQNRDSLYDENSSSS